MKSKSKQRISNQAFSDGYDNIKWNSDKQDKGQLKVQDAYKKLSEATDNYRKAKQSTNLEV